MARRARPKATAAYIGDVSERTLEGWRRRGIGPPFLKLEGVVLYDLDAVDRWLAAHVRKTRASSDRGPDAVV
jgi:phage terminase Nu1 subunit (DNA packaging protein)